MAIPDRVGVDGNNADVLMRWSHPGQLLSAIRWEIFLPMAPAKRPGVEAAPASPAETVKIDGYTIEDTVVPGAHCLPELIRAQKAGK